MVEGALVLLTMLAMIIFVLDMGRILLIQQYITERARATVRAAVVNNWDPASDKAKNYLVYNSITAPNGGGAGFMGLLPSQVTYSSLGANGSARLQVKVSGVPALVLIPFIAGTYTLAPITATLPAQSLGSTN